MTLELLVMKTSTKLIIAGIIISVVFAGVLPALKKNLRGDIINSRFEENKRNLTGEISS